MKSSVAVIASPTLFAFVGRGNPGIRARQSSFYNVDFYFDVLPFTKAAWIASSQKAAPRNDVNGKLHIIYQLKAFYP
jgi:hypothetical protein